MATAWEYVLIVINAIIIVGTVVGGLLTILAIRTRPNLRKLVNVPLVSLSCADMLFSSLNSPFWIHQMLNPQWEPPPALCWFVAYISPVLWGASLSHMFCIALQRYFKVCTKSTRLNSTRALVVMLFITWLVPIVSFLPVHIGEEVKVDPKMKICMMANSDKLWAKIPSVLFTFVLPYIGSLTSYILIQNHVRKSKRRVHANAQGGLSARLAVKHTRGEGGSTSGAGPSTSTEIIKSAKSVKNLEGVMGMGEKKFTPSGDGQNDRIEPGKPKGTMILVAPAPGTGQNQQGTKSLPSAEQLNKSNGYIEPPKGMTLKPIATVSDQTAKAEQQQHAVPGKGSQNSNSPAERQITKMMMMLFAVYTVCCMPMIVMVIFSDKIPAEAFNVAQLLGLLNGALNPIVYGVMNKNIRHGYEYIWDRVLNFIM